MKLWYRALTGLAVAASAAVLAPAALATITPTMTLDQSAGTAAGQSQNLGLDLSFGQGLLNLDSPDNLTINLPPGLLANASLTTGSDGSGPTCISQAASATPGAGCLIGTGSVADASIITLSVNYYLVAPPAGSSGDLAGLEVYSTLLSAQVGTTGDVLIRPTGDPDGVGATIKLTLPSTLDGLPTTITSVDSTFDGLRYPTTGCSGTPLNIKATVNSYDDTATNYDLTQPLSVTGCSSLPYNPLFTASATRDSGDSGVAVTTDITQLPIQNVAQAPSSSVSLAFPTTMFGPNLGAIKSLCTTASVSGCTAVGSVSATSPLYPTALTGQAYLTGNSSGLDLKLVFPAPFPLTLTGTVSLTTNTASFTGLPDIPLTDLKVTLNGGPGALFVATCQASSGSATANLGAQNGATVSRTATITYSGCPADHPPVGSTGSGSGSGTGSGTSTTGSATAPTISSTTTASIGSPSARGLASGKPTLTFKLAAGKKAAKLSRVTVKLPSGLSFRSHKKNGKKLVKGVTLNGAKAKSATLSGSKLVVVFKKGTRKVTVRLGSKALKETKALRAKAKAKKIKSLTLKVTIRNAKGRSKALTAKVTRLNLGG